MRMTRKDGTYESVMARRDESQRHSTCEGVGMSYDLHTCHDAFMCATTRRDESALVNE